MVNPSRPRSTSLATSQDEMMLTPSPSPLMFLDDAQRVFAPHRALVDPPYPHMGVEQDHCRASHSSSATGSNGSSDIRTAPFRACGRAIRAGVWRARTITSTSPVLLQHPLVSQVLPDGADELRSVHDSLVACVGVHLSHLAVVVDLATVESQMQGLGQVRRKDAGLHELAIEQTDGAAVPGCA